MIYDLFYVSKTLIANEDWQQFSKRFPLAQKIENVKTFQDIKSRAFTKMFWVVWNDLVIEDDFNFDYVVLEWDREFIHVFKNKEFYDGVTLFSKSADFIQKEFENRFFITNKKEIDIVASTPKPFDIIFISYTEVDADINFKKLKDRFPRAKRIHGVKGIHQAHIKAAELATTEMLWVVDADAVILDDFDFTVEQIPYYSNNARRMLNTTVHVWRSRNPVNSLEYGYGGVKLLPRNMTIDMDVTSTDMTTGISSKFKAMEQVSNLTVFNTDPFNSWKSAFRECCKLASRVIDRQQDVETQERLDAWCTLQEDALYGFHAYAGAIAGRKYGEDNKENKEALKKINDFAWLNDEYRRTKV
jgi:hypothetical protein